MAPLCVLFVLQVLVLATSHGFVVPTKAAAGCVVDANDKFPDPDPLILKPGAKPSTVYEYKSAFYLPDSTTGLMSFNTGDSLRLACPGPNNVVVTAGKAEAIAVCAGNNTFQIDGKTPVTVDKLQCTKSPFNYAYRIDKCYKGSQTGIQIGFDLAKDEFFTFIYTCFDETTLNTVYSYEVVVPELAGYQHGAPRPSFLPADFYGGRDMYAVYAINTQLSLLTRLLGSSSLANKYIKDDGNHFMAKGHFAPRADFVFGTHTRATFYFVNVAPQWQVFNAENWEVLEQSVRDLAVLRNSDLQVYTGPHGVMTLPDVNNNQVEIFLIDDNKLAVPQLYWKAVYEPSTKSGVVVIGINNPYVETAALKQYIICKDILSSISWYKPKNDLEAGYMYACSVNDFRSATDVLPDFQTDSLLS